MESQSKKTSGQGESFSTLLSAQQNEDEQIALIIKLFELAPVSTTAKAISITGDTRTDFYERQDPKSPIFDSTFPDPIGGRRSQRSPRRYWTIDILRWRIRQANLGER